YQLQDGKGQVLAGFSLDVAPREGDLERVPVSELEDVLGADTVLQVGRSVTLRDALGVLRQPPIELLPYLMMMLLVVLTCGGLLATRFYRRVPAPGATP